MDPSTSRADEEVLFPVASLGAAELGGRFRALFDAELPYVWTSLRRLGVQERDREDLANEVFFRVHRRFADYDPARPVRPWLFAFAVRVASEQRRLARNRFEHVGADEDAGPRAVRAAGDDAEARQLVMLGLSRLDMDKRAVFVLHYLDEFSIPEVARALEIPEGTAYSRLRAAKGTFTAAIRQIQGRTP